MRRTAVSAPLTQLVLGVNSAFPTHGTIGVVPADLGLHLIYYRYLTRLDYPVADNVAKQLRSEAEFALSIGTRGPVKLRAFGRHVVNFDLAGLTFRVGEDVRAIRLFFSRPTEACPAGRRNGEVQCDAPGRQRHPGASDAGSIMWSG